MNAHRRRTRGWRRTPVQSVEAVLVTQLTTASVELPLFCVNARVKSAATTLPDAGPLFV
jgi:hypothetical protein